MIKPGQPRRVKRRKTWKISGYLIRASFNSHKLLSQFKPEPNFLLAALIETRAVLIGWVQRHPSSYPTLQTPSTRMPSPTCQLYLCHCRSYQSQSKIICSAYELIMEHLGAEMELTICEELDLLRTTFLNFPRLFLDKDVGIQPSCQCVEMPIKDMPSSAGSCRAGYKTP